MKNTEVDSSSASQPSVTPTLIGASAVLMWATLAPLTAAANVIPPFQLLSMTFGVACVVGVLFLGALGGRSRLYRLRGHPLDYWLLVVGALFGYHALYFLALSLAPAAEAGLIAYLWPLLIVLLSGFVSRSPQLRATHVLGALSGLSGVAVLILSHREPDALLPHRTAGLGAAFSCALIWSTYSVINRRFRGIPCDAIVGACGVVALLGWATHVAVEGRTVAPTLGQGLAILGLGIGPVGLAFLAWDHGTKHGNLSLLGALAYAAPLLSTALLALLGQAPASMNLLVAGALVVGGAWIAAAG